MIELNSKFKNEEKPMKDLKDMYNFIENEVKKV
ncbi:MAG: hypothetical protein PWP26_575, partial [Thermodesulfobacterium sp.]|nr:hypothetical protein [Thermodesulfobacterium sp.]